MTVKMEEREGLEKLKVKVQDRVKRIEKVRATAKTKAMLLKARVMSVINYTAAIQKLDEEQLKEWGEMIYKSITRSERSIRRDMVYERENKGGMGMMDITEEYKVNRLRGLMQMIQTGEAQAGRGQNTWIQEALLEELEEEEPCLEILKEMKDIMIDIGVEWQTTVTESRKPWTEQRKAWEQQEGGPRRGIVVKSRQKRMDIPQEKMITGKEREVPTHVVRWYETQGNNLDRAITKAEEEMKRFIKAKERQGPVVRLRKQTMGEIEEQVGGVVGEWFNTPVARSTNLQIEPDDLTKGICKAVVIN